jgi:preprotein translocase subunit SecA
VVKETCRRLVGTEVVVTGQKLGWDMIPYDVQLIGGIALHRGTAAEMQTGEGKTLVRHHAPLPERPGGAGGAPGDGEQLPGPAGRRVDGAIYGTWGSRWGSSTSTSRGSQTPRGLSRRHHLRDEQRVRLRLPPGQHGPLAGPRVQRPHFYAIIDEVDSILIDEARTPLIISGPVSREPTSAYKQLNPWSRASTRSSRIATELIFQAEPPWRAGTSGTRGEAPGGASGGPPSTSGS